MSGDQHSPRSRDAGAEPGRGLEDRHYHPRLGWMNGQMRDFLTLLARDSTTSAGDRTAGEDEPRQSPVSNCGLDISHRAPQAEHCDGNERTPPVHARSMGRTRRGPERSRTVVSRKLDTDLLPKDCDAGGLYLSAETDRERAQTVEVAERTAKLARAFPNENLVAVLMWPRMRAYLRDAEHRQPSCRRAAPCGRTAPRNRSFVPDPARESSGLAA